ncbi:MAG: hypothetical protein O3A51_11740 [Verrucomicrobia bacterium]|nr:hypothetical protein [Verrucomicrobiota bacterium]
MRKTNGILLGLVVIVVALAALQPLLNRKLQVAVKTRLVPDLAESLGVKVSIQDTALNIFQSSVSVTHLTIGNPSGFDGESLFAAPIVDARVHLLPLLRGRFDVSSIRAGTAAMDITRRADKQINVAAIRRPGGRKRTAKSAASHDSIVAEAEPSPQRAMTGTTPTIIDKLELQLALTYRDLAVPSPPFELPMDVSLQIRDLVLNGTDGKPATITLKAHRRNDPTALLTALNGTLAPVSDTSKPTFTLAGHIENVDAATLTAWTPDVDFTCQRADIDLDLVCRAGQFDRAQSRLRLQLVKPALSGKLAGRTLGVQLPDQLTIDTPVGGSLQDPSADFETAIIRAVLTSFATPTP